GEGQVEPEVAGRLRIQGEEPETHKARRASPSVLTGADQILVMEQAHQVKIAREVPQVSGKTFLLGEWCGQREIPDPYRQSREAVEHVYQLIDQCVDSWAPYIK